MRSALMTPRPVPGRLVPVAGSAFVIALALPVFLLAGWAIGGWALAAVLWVAMQGVGLLLTRLRGSVGSLAASGVLAFGLMFKSVTVLVVLVAVAVSDPHLALAGALTYALAYTLELGLSLFTYFGAPAE
jgi:hypothetical protein